MTIRSKAELINPENLSDNEQRLKLILNSVRIGIIIVDPTTHIIVDANDTAIEMIGAPREEIIGRKCHHCICPADIGKCPIIDLKQSIDNSERVMLRTDGSKIPVLKTVVSTVIDGQTRLIESFVDISERKKSEQELQKAHDELERRVEERTAELAKANTSLISEIAERKQAEEEIKQASRENERILSSISSALIVCDMNGKICKWNKAAEGMFGIPAEKAIGLPLLNAGLQFEDDNTSAAILEAINASEQTNLGHVSVICPDGRHLSLILTVAPILDNEGNAWECVVVGSDITELRSLEIQLLHAQRLESIGQLAAGVAHEINTPIQYIGDNTRFLQESIGQVLEVIELQAKALEKAKEGVLDEETLKAVENARENADIEYLEQEIPKATDQAIDGVNRVAKIVRALKQFSHPGGTEISEEDLNSAVESTINVSRNEWKYVADVISSLDPEMPLVPCMIADLNQVILNLIVNAAHAIAQTREECGTQEKGTITVTTKKDGDWARIIVEDTGGGIPESIRQRIFEPFFTTKAVGKGTGQGLAMARSIVTNTHGGTIDFESEEGKGTRFTVSIPLLRKAA